MTKIAEVAGMREIADECLMDEVLPDPSDCVELDKEKIVEVLCEFEQKYYEETGTNLPLTGLATAISQAKGLMGWRVEA